MNTFVDNIEKLTTILYLFGININVIPAKNSSFLSKASLLCWNVLLIELKKQF